MPKFIINTIALEQLKRHEGLRLKPYHCTAGKLTIGYGRNIEDKGISKSEANYLLLRDIEEVEVALNDRYEWFEHLSTHRQAVLINMAFNMGMHGLATFKNMIAAIEMSDYTEASHQMLESGWAKQVGSRAVELSKIMAYNG